MRNLLFFSVGLVGLGALAANLFSSSRIESPPDASDTYRSPHFQQTVRAVDDEFHSSWAKGGLQPTPLADNATVARRLSLALTGTIPSFEELRAFQSQPEDQQLQWWISHLLADRRTADYLAERFARAYVGAQDGPFLVYRRRRFVTWLSDQIHTDRPYDAVVRDLIADTGLWTDSPSVNFLTATLEQNQDGRPDPIRLAARTSRAFLGMRIDCLQCHDDRLGNVYLGERDAERSGEQTDFHQLAAFFSEAKASLLGISDDRQGYQYLYLDAEEESLVPARVPFNDHLLKPAQTRREQLAHWVTHPENQPFARATVNRVWALMFGRPLVEPVDDIPLYGEFPAGLESLAGAFVDSNHDLKWLICAIATTEAFRRDSRAEFELTPKHEQQFAAFPLTRLRPEQVAGALIQSTSLKTIDANAHIVMQLSRYAQQNEFIKRYGDVGEDEFDDRGGTVTQRLLMMNGKLTKERTSDNPILNAANRIARLAPTDETAVETAYLSILTRRPSPRESQHFAAELKGTKAKPRVDRLEDIYWVLLNSSEFSWNH